MPLWYFAYGSNMSPSTFVERRRMSPLESRRARLDGYRLCFDIPIGPGERGVANLAADAEARTHGVAHLLSEEEALRLDRTEGVPHLYYREAVTLVTDHGALAAFTYRSRVTSSGRKPSARYLDILLDGARTHALPDDWLRVLEAFELAFDERIGAVRPAPVRSS
jgi:cation transport regulator ChaC